MTRAASLFGAFWVLMLVITLTQGIDDSDSDYENSNRGDGFKGYYDSFRHRFKRWQCDSGFGGGGGGGGGGQFGAMFGGGGGGWGGGQMGLGDVDPSTLILLTLLSGTGGNAAPPPPMAAISPGAADDSRLVPLPPSGQQPITTTEVPMAKPMLDDLSEELSYGLRPPAPAQPPVTIVEADDAKKAQGHVTPGNRCEEDTECVAHAQCVEALRQKYCVCAPGRRPKGGMCV